MESRRLRCSFVQAQVAMKLFVAGAVLVCYGAGMADGAFTKLFTFGDSYVDTGNRDATNSTRTPIGPVNQDWRPPYGQTYPTSPAGRFSDGKLLSDYLADYMGLRPAPYRFYKANPATPITGGINFAVGGAGVFDNLGFTKTGDQVAQFQAVLNTGVYSSSVYTDSLILFVISGNDYAAFLRNNGVSANIFNFVPSVVTQLLKDLQSLYALGFRNFAVSFIEPLGCLPSATASVGYTTCNPLFNAVSTYHNSYLSILVNPGSVSLPGANIIFFNTELVFSSVLLVSTVPTTTGFGPTPLRPCCTPTQAGALCGDVGPSGNLFSVCSNPSASFFWDENHPTQAGWAYIFNLFLTAPFGLYTGGRSLVSFLA